MSTPRQQADAGQPDPADTPLVSVTITTRNRRARLEQALASIAGQDYPRIEVLVFDDASSDDTRRFLEQHHPEVRLLCSDRNIGLVVARNRLAAAAKGEFIVSLDDDAGFVGADVIAKSVARLRANPEIAVVSYRIVQNGHAPSKTPRHDHRTFRFQGCGYCIRKAAFQQIGGYKELFFHQGEEADLSLRLLDAGFSILHSADTVVTHDPDRISRDWNRMHVYGPRNVLLCAWFNEPFPSWPVSTVKGVAGCLLHGLRRGHTLLVLKGFGLAVRDWLAHSELRKPVSPQTMQTIVRLRRHHAR